jgi:hypothetical protein
MLKSVFEKLLKDVMTNTQILSSELKNTFKKASY